MENKMLELLKTRRSVRSYKPEQIAAQELDAVLEAGTYAPTGMGMQSPVIVAVQDAQTRQAVMELNVRRAMNRIGVELFPYYLAVRMADTKAQSPYRRREKIENIIAVRELYQEILLNDECVTLRQLAVGGRELMELGMRPGRELGSMLSELLEYVIDDPERNTKEKLCNYVKEKLDL